MLFFHFVLPRMILLIVSFTRKCRQIKIVNVGGVLNAKKFNCEMNQ